MHGRHSPRPRSGHDAYAVARQDRGREWSADDLGRRRAGARSRLRRPGVHPRDDARHRRSDDRHMHREAEGRSGGGHAHIQRCGREGCQPVGQARSLAAVSLQDAANARPRLLPARRVPRRARRHVPARGARGRRRGRGRGRRAKRPAAGPGDRSPRHAPRHRRGDRTQAGRARRAGSRTACLSCPAWAGSGRRR